MQDKIIIISGPSGSGKSSVVQGLLSSNQKISKVITCTTRQPRAGEVHGKDYYFLSQDEFLQKTNQDKFIEHTQTHNFYYGTYKSEVQRIHAQNKIPLFVIDVKGFVYYKKIFNSKKIISIFIKSPSGKELKHRIESRSNLSETELKTRLKTMQEELKMAPQYTYQVENKNNQLEKTITQVLNIINFELEKK